MSVQGSDWRHIITVGYCPQTLGVAVEREAHSFKTSWLTKCAVHVLLKIFFKTVV